MSIIGGKYVSKKLNIEFIRADFAKKGYELLTKTYENNYQKLEYICFRGHRHSISWGNWKSGKECPTCVNRIRAEKMKKDFDIIKKSFKDAGFTLLTKVYKNNYQKLEYICPIGHSHKVTWNKWQHKKYCPICTSERRAKEQRKCFAEIKKSFEDEGYELLTTVYEGAHQKLEYICPRGHRHSITWANWQQNQRCPCFSKYRNRPTIESIREEFAKEGYELLTTVYENNKQKLEYICSGPEKHRHCMTWSGWYRGTRCPFCKNNNISKWEKTIKNFLTESNIDHIPNDRTQLINPKTGCNLELDIWFPNLNKAIECNGLYWHSKPERKECDKIKQQLCKDQNIDLLVITDKEWNDDIDKCKADILSFLEIGNKSERSRGVQ